MQRIFLRGQGIPMASITVMTGLVPAVHALVLQKLQLNVICPLRPIENTYLLSVNGDPILWLGAPEVPERRRPDALVVAELVRRIRAFEMTPVRWPEFDAP